MASVDPAFFCLVLGGFFGVKSNAKLPEEVNFTLSTRLVVNVQKEKVFSCFLLSLDELAALISAAHEQAQSAARYTSALDTTHPCRNYRMLCSEISFFFFFPELCESKPQLQNQGNCPSE